MMKRINSYLLVVFLAICIFFPNDIFSLKKISFGLLMLLNWEVLLKGLLKRDNLWITFFGFLFPSVIILYSIFFTNDPVGAFSRGFSGYILLLLIVIEHYQIDYEKILSKILVGELVILLMVPLLDLCGVMNINTSPFRIFVYQFDIGFMGKSPLYPFYYKFFLKTSPLMIILLFRNINRRKYIWAFLAYLSLVFSGTRANVLFSLLFIVTYFIGEVRGKVRFWMVFSLLFSLIAFLPFIFSFTNDIMMKGAVSDAVRIGHIRGLKELFGQNPSALLFGTGLGSDFFSYGKNAYVDTIELPYLDIIRQIGIFFGMVFFAFLCRIFLRTRIKYKRYLYILYLLIASTNPLLYSSTGYLIYIYMSINDHSNRDLKEGKFSEESSCAFGNV